MKATKTKLTKYDSKSFKRIYFIIFFFVLKNKPGKKNHFVVEHTSRFESSSFLFIHLSMVRIIKLIAVYRLTLNDDPPPLYIPEYIKEVCSVRYGGMDMILKLLCFFQY